MQKTLARQKLGTTPPSPDEINEKVIKAIVDGEIKLPLQDLKLDKMIRYGFKRKKGEFSLKEVGQWVSDMAMAQQEMISALAIGAIHRMDKKGMYTAIDNTYGDTLPRHDITPQGVVDDVKDTITHYTAELAELGFIEGKHSQTLIDKQLKTIAGEFIKSTYPELAGPRVGG